MGRGGKKRLGFVGAAALAASFSAALAAPVEPDWSRGFRVERGGRANPYGWSADVLREKVREGKRHALQYPVEPTAALLPLRPVRELLDGDSRNPFRRLFQGLFRGVSRFESFDHVLAHLGLQRFPEEEGDPLSPFGVPRDLRGGLSRMGASLIERHGSTGLTVSCAGCHSTTLFGRPVLGLTNRFPRENEFFFDGKKASKLAPPFAFRVGAGATAGEERMYADLREALRYVGVRMPETLGLDTSLAQVALSLAKRGEDPWAERDPAFARHPREEILERRPADSKPAPWWNLKYKNRWLLDGSVVSGNPVFTNFLWNEIGRGTDLRALDRWMTERKDVIEELTTAVFATEAPRFTDFFPAERISLPRAQRGEALFRESCAKCHGHYEKAWSLPGSESLPLGERIRTLTLAYPEETPVKDVGTDPLRAEGMHSLAKGLNRLEISRRHGIVIEPQKGYVPPPLAGLFARFPYFHNNSIPNLCVLLTRAEERPARYLAGEPVDPARHYDLECVGYPIGDRAPSEWRSGKGGLFDAGKEGLSNAGHSERILVGEDGRERFSREEKRDLIEFLKTL